MNIFNVFLLFFAALFSSAVATNYCSSSICKSGVTHIACGHSGKFASTCPADASMVSIDDSLRTIIVNGHNTKRNLVASGSVANHSPACRMATMQWDNELASLAALNVRQCSMTHDKCHNTDAFKYSGQNLAWMGYFGTANNTAQMQKAIDIWYGEMKNSNMNYINSYPNNYKGPSIGHFTVMNADRNIRVGCAASTYSVTGASYKAYLVACNYATTNMINFPIYASCSKAGSSCSTGKNSQYPNLCSASEAYEVNKWF